jgi:hypothetical protein
MSKAAELAALIGSGQAQGNKNLVINGAMQVAQRGTSGTQASNYPSLDRWFFQESGVSYTAAQVDVSGTPTDYGFTKSMKITNTAVGSNTASDYLFFAQRIEGQNIRNSGWDYQDSNKFLVYSFWAKSSLAGTYLAGVQAGNGEGVFNQAFTLVADTWTKVKFSVPGRSSLTATGVPNTNAQGWEFRVILHWGTNYTTSGTAQNQWINWDSAARADDFSQNWIAASGATFEITGCQLEVGEVATPFEHESYAATLQKCQRYHTRIEKASGQTYSSTAAVFCGVFPTEMRTSPTGSLSGALTIGQLGIAGTKTQSSSNIALSASTNSASVFNAECSNFSSLTTHQAAAVAGSTQPIIFDSEL